jgi:hypothetical protein
MSIQAINPFIIPLEIWSYKKATKEEMLECLRAEGRPCLNVRNQLIRTVKTAVDAAAFVASTGASVEMKNHVEKALAERPGHYDWRLMMPSKTPKALSDYQNKYPPSNMGPVSAEIDKVGFLVPNDQILFHGGTWPLGQTSITMNRPFSTSFCPEVALRNAEYKAKSYDAGRIDLMVVRVVNPKTKAFVFKINGTRKGHEKEVLFAEGATATLVSNTLVRDNYPVGKYGFDNKNVPIYVVEISIT